MRNDLQVTVDFNAEQGAEQGMTQRSPSDHDPARAMESSGNKIDLTLSPDQSGDDDSDVPSLGFVVGSPCAPSEHQDKEDAKIGKINLSMSLNTSVLCCSVVRQDWCCQELAADGTWSAVIAVPTSAMGRLLW